MKHGDRTEQMLIALYALCVAGMIAGFVWMVVDLL